MVEIFFNQDKNKGVCGGYLGIIPPKRTIGDFWKQDNPLEYTSNTLEVKQGLNARISHNDMWS
jgi:hypothetical protein